MKTTTKTRKPTTRAFQTIREAVAEATADAIADEIESGRMVIIREAANAGYYAALAAGWIASNAKAKGAIQDLEVELFADPDAPRRITTPLEAIKAGMADAYDALWGTK